jgi:hypothetical protein
MRRSCPNICISSTIQQIPLEYRIVVQKFFNFDWILNSCLINLCSHSGSHCWLFWCFSWFYQSFQANDGAVFQSRPWQFSSHPSQAVVRISSLIRRLIIYATEKASLYEQPKRADGLLEWCILHSCPFRTFEPGGSISGITLRPWRSPWRYKSFSTKIQILWPRVKAKQKITWKTEYNNYTGN